MTLLNGYEAQLLQTALQSANEHYEKLSRPSYILKPALTVDGNQWCALFGENLQDGIAGFGDTPELAYADFDHNWNNTKIKR